MAAAYRGEGDGCTVRLATSDTRFVPHPPQSLVFDPATGVGRVSKMTVVDGLGYDSGIHENDTEDDVIETTLNVGGGTLDICRFHDDYVPSGGLTGSFFGLQACWAGVELGNTTCTLTIED